ILPHVGVFAGLPAAVELRRGMTNLAPARLVEIPQSVPVIPSAPIMMAPGGDRPAGQLHNERRTVRMVAVPGARVEDPAHPAITPRATRGDRESMLRYPLGEVKRDVAIVP